MHEDLFGQPAGTVSSPNTFMNLYGIKVWCYTALYRQATVGHNHL